MFGVGNGMKAEPTGYQQRSLELLQEIYRLDYWSSRLTSCLESLKMTPEGVKRFQYSKTELNRLWNEFWFVLPDNASIRTETFFKLCDLAEDE
jgi:hypothetical protein